MKPDRARCSLDVAGCVPRGADVDWFEVARTSVDPTPGEREYMRHMIEHQRAGDLLPSYRQLAR